jgi:deazaflavin-dependent oxidoreductase (nitroreductase family)
MYTTQTAAFQQIDRGVISYPKSAWHQALFKTPIPMWRLGLGPLIGGFLMLITHTGRRSGLPRRTVVEYHMMEGKKYAPCAFCPRADWYKNITANPYVTIQTSHGTERVKAVRINDDQELLDVYNLFMRRDPPLTRWHLHSLRIQDDPADILQKKDRIYWFRFDPTDRPTPPGLEADLAWVVPVVSIGLFFLWRALQRLQERKR